MSLIFFFQRIFFILRLCFFLCFWKKTYCSKGALSSINTIDYVCGMRNTKRMTRHPRLRHDNLCKVMHVRIERQQMLTRIDGVKQKKTRKREKKKKKPILSLSCRHFMTRIVVTLSFSLTCRLYQVEGSYVKWENDEEKRRMRKKRTVLVTGKKTAVVTSQNHVCFLNHTLCVLIPFERFFLPLFVLCPFII